MQVWEFHIFLQMSYDVALVPLIKEAVQRKWVESATPTTTQGLSIWLMDMQLSADFVTVLFAVRYEGRPTMEHGLGKKIVLKDTMSCTNFICSYFIILCICCMLCSIAASWKWRHSAFYWQAYETEPQYWLPCKIIMYMYTLILSETLSRWH